jgi:hypothetical protein
VRVGNDHVGELLNITEAMRKAIIFGKGFTLATGLLAEILVQRAGWGGASCVLCCAVLMLLLMLPLLLDRDIPGGQLGPHIICGADETRFGQGTAKKCQLAETYGADLAFNPSGSGAVRSALGTRSDQSSPSHHTGPRRRRVARVGDRRNRSEA